MIIIEAYRSHRYLHGRSLTKLVRIRFDKWFGWHVLQIYKKQERELLAVSFNGFAFMPMFLSISIYVYFIMNVGNEVNT